MEIGHTSSPYSLYDLAILVKFIDPQSGERPYHNPDENSPLYSSTEWKLEKVKRVFQKYQKQILATDFFITQKKALDKFVKTNFVNSWLNKPE